MFIILTISVNCGIILEDISTKSNEQLSKVFYVADKFIIIKPNFHEKGKKIIFTKSLAKKSSLASIFSLKYGNDTIFHYKKKREKCKEMGTDICRMQSKNTHQI